MEIDRSGGLMGSTPMKGWRGVVSSLFALFVNGGETRFNKIAIPNNKFQMAKLTRKPLAYRESKNFLIYV